MNKLGFRNTLILSISILIVICLILSNGYSYTVLKSSTVANVDTQSINTLRTEGARLEQWFNHKFSTIDSLSKHYQPNLKAEDYVGLVKYTKDISGLSAVLISLDDGQSFSTISSPLWKNGVAIIDKYDARQRPWYSQGKQANGALDITNVYTSASSGKQLVSIVKSINGGVLLGDIEVSILEETVNSIDYPGAVTVIFDENGKTLASNSTALKMGDTLQSIGMGDVNKQMMSADSNKFDYELKDVEKVAFTQSINMVNGKKWYIFIGVDKSIAYKAADEALLNAVISSFIMVIVSSILCIALLRVLYSPILLLKNLVQDLSQGNGDLTRRLPVSSTDDLGQISQGINTFIANLQDMMTQVSHASKDIASSVGKLDTLTGESHSVLNEHRRETEQVVTALDEMSATSNDVATNTADAAQFTSLTNDQAVESQGVMSGANETVGQLVVQVDSTSESIAQLGTDMTEITNVLNVIGEIADQTNLLALNAAIEAARAGEHGRGFAVVADEVRTLASRTQSSTAEIEATLQKIRVGVNTAIGAMEQTKSSCEETASTTVIVATDLEKITESIQQINLLNTQIATAAEEQNSVSDEITRNMSKINDMVDKLTHVGSDTNVEKQNLVSANSQLNNIVGLFKLS
ncbi:methyl-accepting chemotaxis protein [Vibrio algarum]|uniref:Methyl-accepting chemotaxis protein n=1 Tax=Vibrio algarum TaxID=3020714 RepID=A0ABT4YVS5_9VIBR|nr:methyl-accepting chemotaxis protein [Vibrio sp. KJ40-1]MDB1125492.1 methyl-accepting chemotaxis protein [Vibrio sp. KJ40-1]